MTTAAVSKLFILTTLIVVLFFIMGECSGPSYIEYSTVTGYFLQDDPATDPESFDYVRN